MKISELFIYSGLVKSKNEFNKTINGLYLNNKHIESDREMTMDDTVGEGNFIVLRKGKKNYMLIKLTDEESEETE